MRLCLTIGALSLLYQVTTLEKLSKLRGTLAATFSASSASGALRRRRFGAQQAVVALTCKKARAQPRPIGCKELSFALSTTPLLPCNAR